MPCAREDGTRVKPCAHQPLTNDTGPFVGKSLVVKPVAASQEEYDQGIAVVPRPVGKRWEDVHELKVGATSASIRPL